MQIQEQGQNQTKLSDFKIINKLGEGSFSNVYKVIRIRDNQEYAMKKVKMNILRGKEKQNAINEVRLLASIKSKHIVAYKDAFIESNCLYVIMEFCKNGDLQGKIDKHIKLRTQFKEQEILKAMKHMTQGLQDLHQMQIMHRDLKSANVFIDADGNYKLGDLNVSKLSKQGGLAHTQTGTPYYASPEIWGDKPYNNKCDIWSLGCVVYEMAALKPAFRALDMEGLYRKIKKGVFERIPKNYNQDLQSLIQQCLKVQPYNRPDTQQLLNNEYLQIQNQQENEQDMSDIKSQLLNTIKLPRNLVLLNNGQLPKSQYKQLGSQECPEFKSKNDLESIGEENEENYEGKKGINNNTRKNRIISAGHRRPVSNIPIIQKQNHNQNQQSQKKRESLGIKLPVVQKYDHKTNNKINDIKSNLSQQYNKKQNEYQQQRRNRPESEKIINKAILMKQNSNKNVQKQNQSYDISNKENNNNNNISNNYNVLSNKIRQQTKDIIKVNNNKERMMLLNQKQKIGYDKNNNNHDNNSNKKIERPPSSTKQRQYKPKFDYNEMLKQKIEDKENMLLGNYKPNLDNNVNHYKPPIDRFQSAKNAQILIQKEKENRYDKYQKEENIKKIYLQENKNHNNKNYDIYNYCHNANQRRLDIQNQSRQQIYYKHHKLF